MASVEQIDVDKVLVGLKRAAATAANEEELRITDSGILQSEVISKLGIPSPRHEKYTFVTGGRIDALYGHVVIEYKAPGKLLKEPDIAKAKEQLIGYIKEEAEVEGRFKLFLGVLLADKIGFVRYDEKSKTWLLRGPYDLNRETVLRLVEAIRGLRRKKLAVDELLKDFGPKSDTAVSMVNVFYGKGVSSKNPKVEALFNDWKRLFSQVCSYSPEKLKGLEAEYGLSGKIDYSALLFAVHTYYALVMKLLAAEVAYLFGAGRWLKSYVAELEDANMKGLDAFKRTLEDLESGGVFKKFLNITNFIEGDYFSWYLEELDKKSADAIARLARTLADYEPATPVLEPEYTRDLLKRLYQNLLPTKIRHDLGEYYTPDWLAELLLDEVGVTVESFESVTEAKNDLTKPLNLRVLDPACGSGTFIVLALRRLREYAEKHYLKDVLVNYVLRNVVGFDLNPLAVLTARTNYLLAIADLLGYAQGSIEIPVYLADSLLVETKTTLTGISYVIRTHVGVFELPKTAVDKGILGRLLEAIDRFLRLRYTVEDFLYVIKDELSLDENELRLTGALFKVFLQLEKEGKNHVWASIIKNAFAPLTITGARGRFEYVIGNPPWINWESLPGNYRESTKDLWDQYGLLGTTKGMGIGKVKKDMAMLFVTRCVDRYLDDSGKLAFLIPFTLYKNQAGAGFRKYIANKCEILKAHDLVELFPFEGAVNRAAMIVVKKGRTKFPIDGVLWQNPRSSGITQEADLTEVRRVTKQTKVVFAPIKENKPETQWMEIIENAYTALRKVVGASPWYRAYAGIYTGLNAVYWINILASDRNTLTIENVDISGLKIRVRKITTSIESNLVYPMLRGREVRRWFVEDPVHYHIVPTDEKGAVLSSSILRVKYPKTYAYFFEFFKQLISRKGQPYKSKLEPYKKMQMAEAEKKAPPFYWLFNVEPSLAKYKVVWKAIAGGISGKAVDFAASVVEPKKDKFLAGKKSIVLTHSLITVPFDNEDEAYYVCGLLNSSPILCVIAAYTYEIRMETHIVKNIKIPKFDSKNEIHLKLVQLSRKAHTLAKKHHQENDLKALDELTFVEAEIDDTAAKIYGLTESELTDIKKTLATLKGEEVEEEFVEEESMEVAVDFLNAVASPNVAGSFEVAITNPPKGTVEIELQLPDRKVELKTDKEQETIKVKIPPLPIGEHKIPYKIITQDKVVESEFTLHVKEKKKFRKDESLTGKLDELLEES
ncbi:MAG: N-6 DNA methylase [Candidatus Bathyarchaeota archaeon]|nr:N-6 DNA methylase [Candidatus Bathyarchaeota archaeon]